MAKVVAVTAVGYSLSPIDIVPDFIPVLGYLDDFIVLPILIALCIKLIPVQVLRQCRKEAEGIWKNGKPKKWYYGIPIFTVWVFAIYFIIKILI